MIGSMAPDFGYFFSHSASRAFTHSLVGLFSFSLPVGLIVWLFYVAVLEKATITLLSDRWHTRFAHTDAITLRLIALACVALLLGSFTHLVWDDFTHRFTWSTDHFPFLLGPTPGLSWLPIYHFLHGLSSVVGLVILWIWAHRLHRLPARSLIRPYEIRERVRVGACWLIGFSAALFALLDWLPHARRRYDTQLFYAAIGLMSGFFIAWCGVSLTLWFRHRRTRVM